MMMAAESLMRRLGAVLLLIYSSWILVFARLPGEFIFGVGIFCSALFAWRFSNRLPLAALVLAISFFVALPFFINLEDSARTFVRDALSLTIVLGLSLILFSLCLPRRNR